VRRLHRPRRANRKARRRGAPSRRPYRNGDCREIRLQQRHVSTGVTIDNSRGACTAIEGGADGDSFLYRAPDRGGEAVPIGRIVVVPFSVDFADGTSWQASAVSKPGERLIH
jgi:hypothetical protein